MRIRQWQVKQLLVWVSDFFNSESAIAINVSHWVKASQNNKIIINAGVSFLAEESVFKGGVSFEF